MTLSEFRESGEGDTRVDLQTRLDAEDAVDMAKVLKSGFVAAAVRTIADLREVDPELVESWVDIEADAAATFDAWVNQMHLRRLQRIAATGRDDE